MAQHHMVGKFTIHDLRPNRLYTDPLPAHSPTVFNEAQALTVACELAEKGFRPRVDFAVLEWINNDAAGTEVSSRSAGRIHEPAERIWREQDAKKRKKKCVVELYIAYDSGRASVRFGWLIVDRSPTYSDARIAFKREEATEFEELSPADISRWFKDLGSPAHVHLCPREVA